MRKLRTTPCQVLLSPVTSLNLKKRKAEWQTHEASTPGRCDASCCAKDEVKGFAARLRVTWPLATHPRGEGAPADGGILDGAVRAAWFKVNYRLERSGRTPSEINLGAPWPLPL